MRQREISISGSKFYHSMENLAERTLGKGDFQGRFDQIKKVLKLPLDSLKPAKNCQYFFKMVLSLLAASFSNRCKNCHPREGRPHAHDF